ncbi:MFS transporter, DHA2 family, multidrug resistance protein [Formivibrio citricus]|uniref:MFS transporter, DHA2 family, multidrug resistance protein n=1 Tax=Formivibrio citricus TaxID=83765 RepID=A0A1I4XCY3_9NEIS|nr:DHA2 family efflux MFS transporter permease subunit [Formivibrio citricus]SFN23791.1 MFS transporter, DHA2 family, multidrug resistance protein [Formivibrio citricus]
MNPILPGLSRSTTPDEIRTNRYIIALTVTLGCVLELVDTSIVNVAIPHMMGTLGASLDEITWVSIGYVVANVIVLPISGFLSHVFGRRNYFILSILLFTFASFACGSSTSLGALVFWRIVQGLGGGGLIATAQVTIMDVFPRKEVATGMAVFGMGIMTGPMLGPTLGGWLTDEYSWPWIFYINLPLGILALLFTLVYVPEALHRRKIEKIDYIGLLMMAAGIGALQLMLERGERLDWFESGEIVAYAVTSILALGAFVIRQLESEHPLVDFRICRDIQYSSGLLFTFLLGASLFSTVFVFPVYVQTLMGYTAWQTGLLILPSAMASGIAMPVAAKAMERGVSARGIIVAGILVFVYSMWGHYHFTTESGVSDFLLPLIIRGLGLGMIFMPLNALTMASIPPQTRADASGLYNLTRQLGGSVGIAASATLITTLGNIKYAALNEHLAGNNALALERLALLKSRLLSLGTPDALADLKSMAILGSQIARQAQMLSFSHLFLLFGLGMVLVLPLLLFMNKEGAVDSEGGLH